MLHKLSIALLFFIFITQSSAAALPSKIVITASEFDEQVKQIETCFDQSYTIGQCTYESDIFLEQAEFDYLVDLPAGKIVSAADIKQAFFYLNKKGIFETIELEINQHEQTHELILHFILHGQAQFAKLIIKGLLVGKDAYQNYYFMQPGELFDEAKHNDSCRAIEQAFAQQGYLDGHVHSIIKHDLKTKAVTVTLYLNRQDRYTIGTAALKLIAPNEHYQVESLSDQLRCRFLDTLSGSWYDKEQITHETRALHHYLTRKGFLQPTIELQEQINHTTKKVDILFTIQLQHRKAFTFCGNQFFSRKQLRDVILEFGTSAGLLPIPLLAEEIEKAYHDKGFWHVSIDAQEHNDQALFAIKEGKRATISHVEFRGIHFGDPQQLEQEHFGRLLKNNYFDAHNLKKSLDSLLDYYVKQGFWAARISKQELMPGEDETHYTLIVTIDEQEQTYLGHITVSHYPALAEQLIPMGSGKPFNLVFIQKQQEWLNNYFKQQGYDNINLKPEYNRQDNQLNVTWHVDITPSQKLFGKTVIHGCTPLKFSYVMRELAYRQKQPWKKDKVKRSLLNLRALHGFQHISLFPDYNFPFDNEQPILLKIYKDDPFELRARGGLALRQLSKYFAFSGVTYTAGGTFLYKNPLNYGDALRVNIDMSRSRRVAQLQYHVPWLFKWPVRTMFQGYSNKYVQPGIVNELKHLYDVTQQGFLIGTRRIWDHVQNGWTIGVEWMKTQINTENPCEISDTQVARAIFFEPHLLDHNIAYVIIEPTVFIDYLDNQLNPTCGSLSLFSIKGMFPISSIGIQAYLLKFLIEQSIFIPVRSVVIALRARVGHIFHEKFSTIMPTERFYLGGAHSIRSYETDAVPPLGKIVDARGREILVPQGGKSMFSINIEVRFPLYRECGGVLFQDFGALSTNNFMSITNKDIVAGTGFGLRYNTPLGPARLDIGFKWQVPDPLLLRYAWFLSIGHAF